MIVRTLAEAEKSSRRVVDPKGNWDSVRLLLKDDNMGFSFHITTIYAGADFQMHYQNHLLLIVLKRQVRKENQSLLLLLRHCNKKLLQN